MKDHEDRIELFFLPFYSPDLNPDEWVWKNVKHDYIYRVVPQHPGHLPDRRSGAPRALESPGGSGGSSPILILRTSAGPAPDRAQSSRNLISD